MTADGRRHRNGGGVLWSIIKTREPKAYKEIMKRAKEFEKQFRQQNIKREPEQDKVTSQETAYAFTNQTTGVSDGPELVPPIQSHPGSSNGEEKRVSVHNRIRVPVSYDDLHREDLKDDAT